MSVEDEHLDALQNIEFAIITVYRSNSDLIDTEVLKSIEALTRLYEAKAKGGAGTIPPIRGITREVADQVREVCDVMLGTSADQDLLFRKITEPKSINDIIDCLRRLHSSIKLWNGKDGRQGYLNFIGKFLP